MRCVRSILIMLFTFALAFFVKESKGATNNFLESKCDSGNYTACYKLGVNYLSLGIYTKAKKMLEIACEHEVSDACIDLGYYYQQQKMFQKAYKLYKRACDLGNFLGCNNLGFLYSKGWGIKQDYKKARQLYEKACNGGIDIGCANLAELYWRGYGTKQDFKKAVSLFKKSCFMSKDKDLCLSVSRTIIFNFPMRYIKEVGDLVEVLCKQDKECYDKIYEGFKVNFHQRGLFPFKSIEIALKYLWVEKKRYEVTGKDVNGLAWAYCSVAEVYEGKGVFKKVKEYLHEGCNLYHKCNLNERCTGVFGCCIKLASFYEKKEKNYEEALKFYLRGYGGLVNLYDYYQDLKRIYQEFCSSARNRKKTHKCNLLSRLILFSLFRKHLPREYRSAKTCINGVCIEDCGAFRIKYPEDNPHQFSIEGNLKLSLNKQIAFVANKRGIVVSPSLDLTPAFISYVIENIIPERYWYMWKGYVNSTSTSQYVIKLIVATYGLNNTVLKADIKTLNELIELFVKEQLQ